MGCLDILRSGRTRVLWGSQAVSVLGDRIFVLAVMWMVWADTGSTALMGLVAIAESIPFIVLGVCGRRLLRWVHSLRQLALIDSLRAILVALMPLVFSVTPAGVGGLLLLVFLLGLLTALFDPSLMARLPREAGDPAQVTAVYGLFDLSARVARVAGPALAGVLLVVVSNRQLLWINAATFVVSAAALWALSGRTAGQGGADTRENPAAVSGRDPGVWGLLSPELKAAFVVHGAVTFGFGAVIALPALFAVNLAQDSPAMYGLAMSAFGLGAVLANPVASRLLRRVEFLLIYGLSASVLGTATVCSPSSPIPSTRTAVGG